VKYLIDPLQYNSQIKEIELNKSIVAEQKDLIQALQGKITVGFPFIEL
jgi:hypothetical protein